MSTSTPRDIIKGPHRLILTPTDLTADFPYGGTELGLCRGLEFRWGTHGYTERAEEWGNAATRTLWTGDWAMLVAILRTWDNDALASLDPVYVAGTSGNALSQYDANTEGSRAGKFVPSAKLLIVSENSPTSQVAALMYAALPIQTQGDALVFSRRTESGIGMSWEGTLDATSGKVYEVGRLEDLTL